MIRRLIAAALLLTMPALAADLPRDVAAFVARRDRCDHFRGEGSDDPARAARIARALERNCRGTDADLARLKRRHAGDPAIRARLDRYEAQVE
ncbi:hypothetical protein [Roseomonas indoligenes]|uniref:UrcA family protein n=1 Tax=Roseomonas indoligenes TaxID=2820811 RepID=A0A940MY58_9PROT|nr:hypothetical protein [Pararoseomonas indoligenes]MBP0494256.1 hypothetical protein [Pararoseomonas indoligenes]